MKRRKKQHLDDTGVDIRHDPSGDPVYWFCPERFLLPLWPEFLLHIRWGKGHFVEHHDFYVYALEIPLYGDLRLSAREKTVLLTPGTVGIIHRGEISRLEIGPAGFCSKLSIGIRGPSMTTLMAAAGLAGRLSVTLPSTARVKALFEEIARLLKAQRTEDIPTISALAMEMINHLALAVSEPPDERLAMALSVGAAHLRTRISVAAIAARLGVSAMTLNRLFKAHTGKSPRQYFHSLRMEVAAELLHSNRLSVQEVAAEVGYDDPLAFSREFRKYSGFSPRAYRNRPFLIAVSEGS